MIKTAFIVNGRSKNKKRFLKKLNLHRHLLKGEFSVVYTSEAGHALSLAREMANEGFTHVIAVGGDGTLHEVVNGIVCSQNPTCAVGLFPGGTANDFAKTVNVSGDMEQLINLINSGQGVPINLGSITFADHSQRKFVNIADLGLGVDVVHRVNRSGRLFGGNFTFFKAILLTLLSYKNQQIRVKTKEWEWSGKINSFVIASGKYFGSGLCIAPGASLASESFSVVIIGDITIRDYLSHVRKIRKGLKIDHPEVTYKVADRLEISSEIPLGIEADGEFIGNGSFIIELERKKLNFLYEAEPANR